MSDKILKYKSDDALWAMFGKISAELLKRGLLQPLATCTAGKEVDCKDRNSINNICGFDDDCGYKQQAGA